MASSSTAMRSQELAAPERRTPLTKKMLRNKLYVVGMAIMAALVVVALTAPYLATHDPTKINIRERAQPPSAEHYFGTDLFGRDIFSRVVHGARISITVAMVATAFCAFFGSILGFVSGYYGGWIDTLVMRLTDALMSLPSILLAIGLVAVLRPSITTVILALGLVYLPNFVRVARATVLSLRELEFIQAARMFGATDLRILLLHIFPNAVTPLLVQATLTFALAIRIEATLSFLGLGPPPPTPSWGAVLSDAKEFMIDAPWMTIYPGLAIALGILGVNLTGDALRDLIDPRLRS